MIVQITFDGTDCFVVLDGVKIAKRENCQWTSLTPDFVVYDTPDSGAIEIHECYDEVFH